jgi:uncharacterized protein (TIGR02453 family)
MTFRGWPVEAIEFYEGLEADNSKAYWQAHKAVYDRCVKAPMEALLADLAPEFGAGRIFRPHRDVRFSADKTPYKTNIAAQMPGGYVSLSADEVFCGGGLYMPSPEQLKRFRAAVLDDTWGEELVGIAATLRAQGYEVAAHEVLKTAPRGVDKDHPRIELLRHKGLVMTRSWSIGAWLGTAKAKDRIVKVLTDAKPLYAWIDVHVG